MAPREEASAREYQHHNRQHDMGAGEGVPVDSGIPLDEPHKEVKRPAGRICRTGVGSDILGGAARREQQVDRATDDVTYTQRIDHSAKRTSESWSLPPCPKHTAHNRIEWVEARTAEPEQFAEPR